ncbi:MAG: hypothetical protein AB7K71_18710 [Polyangiaceae bacterium]
MQTDTNQPQAAPAKSGTLSPADRSTEFVPTQGGAESASAGSLLVWAYLLMWTMLLGFVLMTWLRQQRINDRVARLEQALARKPAS